VRLDSRAAEAGKLRDMARQQTPIGALRFGMYVAELDRPWTETPFMFQGFYLRTPQQLEGLRKYCRHVLIDVERSEPDALRQGASTASAASAPGFAIRGNASYPDRANIKGEFRHAKEVYAQGAKAMKELFHPIESGGSALDAEELQLSMARLADSVVRNPDALLLMSKMREKTVAAHARALQVSIYMMVFGRFLGLEREEIGLLGLLGLLQDIGKTRMPAALLEKTGPLTPQESETVKKHVDLSAHILGITSGLPPKLASLSLLHHERQDGGGYPRGLKAYQIGLYGSIAAICDTYDALMTVRPYAGEHSPSAAVQILLKESGAGFHAQLVEQFVLCLGAFPVGCVVELNSGEVGIVIAENAAERLKPVVMVGLDRAGKPLGRPQILDLARNPRSSTNELYRVRRTLEHSKLEFDPRALFA
jgi:HD-GYP domain-containing protein (c-di-GMP phosphodiesterase class II)